MDCPKNQRTELILKLVSETFHERALRYRGRFSINMNAFADYFPKGVDCSFFERDLSNKNTVKMNESPSKPSLSNLGTNGTSTDRVDVQPFRQSKQLKLHPEEKIDPRLQQRFHESSGPTELASRPSSASTENVAFAAVFETVVYPAIRKSKRRHKSSLPWEELDAIGEIVSFFLESDHLLTCTDPLGCQRCSYQISI